MQKRLGIGTLGGPGLVLKVNKETTLNAQARMFLNRPDLLTLNSKVGAVYMNPLRSAKAGSVSTSPFSASFYSEHLGFFCRQEWQLEKAVAIPIRFRLGSVAYTDYLEQKPNARPGL